MVHCRYAHIDVLTFRISTRYSHIDVYLVQREYLAGKPNLICSEAERKAEAERKERVHGGRRR